MYFKMIMRISNKLSLLLFFLLLIPCGVSASGLDTSASDKTGKPVKVYVIDTGYKPGLGLPADKIKLHDVTGGNGIDSGDEHGESHGTDMTKIYYDKLKNDIDAGKVELHLIKANSQGGRFNDENLNKAMILARDGGANVVSLSLGSTGHDIEDPANSVMKMRLDELQNNGTIVVASAGNDGNNYLGGSYINYIANHPGTIAVGALDVQKNNNEIVYYSSGALTGRVDVYATESFTTKYSRGGTSAATAYAGATIVKEYADGRLDAHYDYDANGKIDGKEAISFINSPACSDQKNIVGSDEAAYKALAYNGYQYDQGENRFYIVNNDGTRRNFIDPTKIGIDEKPAVIAQRMRVYDLGPNADAWKSENKSLYFDIGLHPYQQEIYHIEDTDKVDPNTAYSRKLYNRALNLGKNGWTWDEKNSRYIHNGSKDIMSVNDIKNLTTEQFTLKMRLAELRALGIEVDQNGRLYDKKTGAYYVAGGKDVTINDVMDDKIYNGLLKQKGVSDEDIKNKVFHNLKSYVSNIEALEVSTRTDPSNNPSPPPTTGPITDPNDGTITPTASGGLVNCGKSGQPSCTICDLIDGIHGVIQFLVELMSITGIVIITIAGVMYIVSSGNPSMTSMAKSAIKNVLIGITVILVAFISITFIINTVFDYLESDYFNENDYETGLINYGNMWEFNCDAAASGNSSNPASTSSTAKPKYDGQGNVIGM